MNSELITHKYFFFNNYDSQYTCKLPIDFELTGDFLKQLFCAIIPDEIIKKQRLTNLKGVDHYFLTKHHCPAETISGSGGEELCYISGQYQSPQSQKEDPVPDPIPYTLRYLTKFQEFPDRRTIIYQTEEELRGDFAEAVPILELLKNTELSYFRIALEIFSPKISSYFLPLGPSVTSAILVELTTKTLSVAIEQRQVADLNKIWKAPPSLLVNLDRLILDSFRFSIIEDYRLKMAHPNKT